MDRKSEIRTAKEIGVKEGLEEGIKMGIEEGMEKGSKNEKIEIAKKCCRKT